MENTCSKCGSNLYGNKYKCPFCGEPIKKATSSPTNRTNTYSYANKPSKAANSSTASLSTLEMIILLVISYYLPPLGIIFAISYKKTHSNFSLLAIALAIFGFINYTS